MPKNSNFLYRLAGFLFGLVLCGLYFLLIHYNPQYIGIIETRWFSAGIFLLAFLCFFSTYRSYNSYHVKGYIPIYISLGVLLHAGLIRSIIIWYRDYLQRIDTLHVIISDDILFLLGSISLGVYVLYLLVSNLKRSDFTYVTGWDFIFILFIQPLYSISVSGFSIFRVIEFAGYGLFWLIVCFISRKRKRLLVFGDRHKKKLGDFRQYLYAYYLLIAAIRTNIYFTKSTLERLTPAEYKKGQPYIRGLRLYLKETENYLIDTAKYLRNIEEDAATALKAQVMERFVILEEATAELDNWIKTKGSLDELPVITQGFFAGDNLE